MKLKRRLLLQPTKIHEWESKAVLNPTAIKENSSIHLIYRAVDNDDISSLGHATISNSKIIRESKPFLVPTENYETHGIEDPRITKINNTYYLLYTAFDGTNARTAFAESNDLINWKKRGIISQNLRINSVVRLLNKNVKKNNKDNHNKYKETLKLPQNNSNPKEQSKTYYVWDKDAVILPEKINNKFAMLHRLEPDIQVVYFDNFKDLQTDFFWREYMRNLDKYIIMEPKYSWESEKIGVGSVIKTEHGWLLIYHGVDENKVYRAGAALLDLKTLVEISRLKEPLFQPEYEWEKIGDVNDVVFPEGVVLSDDNDTLKIFYGCADSRIGIAEFSLKKLLKKLLKEKKQKIVSISWP